jgi:hypothetical protein
MEGRDLMTGTFVSRNVSMMCPTILDRSARIDDLRLFSLCRNFAQ